MPTPLRVLILEDQPTDAELFLHQLRQAGFEPDWQLVETEQDYLSALSPDLGLILADYSLPQFDARRALELLQGRGLDIPFIVITGSISEEVAVECIKQGAADYLLKDRLARLGQAVTHALDQKLLREDKRQADRALRESEERFRALIEHGRDNISLLTAEGDLLWENPSMFTTLGYPPNTFVGHSIFELMHPDDQEVTRPLFTQIVQTPGGTRDGVFRMRHSDGSWRWIEATATNLLNEPSVQAVIVNYRDITERQRAEEALRASKLIIEGIINAIPVRVFWKDKNLVYLGCNAIFARDKGFTDPKEVIGKDDYQMARRDQAELYRGDDRQVIESGRPKLFVEEPQTTPEGNIITLLTSKVPLRSSKGEVIGVIGTYMDITERKRVEEALRRNEALLLQTSKMAKVGGWELDLPTMTLLWSLETYRIHEVDSSFQPDLENAINFYTPEARPIISEAVRQASEEGRPYDLELPSISAKGRHIWVRTIGQTEFRNGKCVRFFGTLQDITERKRAEEQIRQRLGELEVLYQSGLALSQSLKPKEIAQRIIDLLDQNLGWHHTTVRLYHPQDETLELLAFNQPGLRSEQEKHAVEEHFKTSIAKKGQGLSGWVIEHGQSVRTSDLMNDARYVETFPGLRSGLYVPIIIGERTIGVISIESEEKNAFSEADERLTVTLANQAASALENARLFEETRQRLTRIQSLRNIDMAISGSTDLHVTFNVALDEIVNQLGIDAACILRLDLHTQTLEYAAGRGFRTHTIEKSLVRLGEGHAGRAALERRPVHIADLPATGAEFGRAGLLACEGFKTYHAIPLIAKGQVLGVLEIFHRAAFEGNGEWLDFLETLAGQTAIAMDNASLFQGLERSNINLLQAYDATIEGWSQAMDLRDKETEGHTQRVTKLTEQLARAIGMSHEEIVHARRGALLHDIGKIGVPDLILLKADKLTEEEWILMKSHPQFAYNMLSPIAYLKPALDIPYCHHEKWDGTGYPRGLKGEQIPLAARLFAIVDVYDALTSDRPYRKAWTKKKTFTYIREQSGTHFDPAVVDAFLAMQLPKRKK